MKNKLFLLLVILSFSLSSQDLHIYYDVHKDSLWYMKNNLVVIEPTVKKGKQVYFHLVEFNNYIYSAKIKATHSTAPFGTQAPGNSMVKGLLSGLVSGFIPGAGLPLLSTPLFGNIMEAIPESSTEVATRGGQEELRAFEEKLKELESQKEEINNLATDLNHRRKSLTALHTTFDFTTALSKNKNVTPSLIKQLLLDHCSEIFMKSANQDIVLDDIVHLNNKLLEIPLLEKTLKDKIKSYETGLNELNQQRIKLQQIDHGIDELYPLVKKLELSEKQINQSADQFSEALEKQVMANDKNMKPDYTSQIQQFYLKYHEIKDNTFSFTHQSGVEQKFLIYEMDLYELDSANTSGDDEKTSIKHIEIKIKSYGGAHFGMSIGLSGSRFNESPQSYIIKDGDKIFGIDQDPYVPYLASLFNLSYDLGSSFSPAICMGLGIPITKNESVDNFGVFIGPGVFVGKSKSILISTGAMFSKVSTLAKGLQVGDTINIGDGIIPTTRKFGVGYFIGVTYNITQ